MPCFCWRQLLTKNPAKRLGKTELAGKDIRSHSFFRLIDWGLVSSQKYELPLLDLSLDTSELSLLSNDRLLSEFSFLPHGLPLSSDSQNVRNWSYCDMHTMLTSVSTYHKHHTCVCPHHRQPVAF